MYESKPNQGVDISLISGTRKVEDLHFVNLWIFVPYQYEVYVFDRNEEYER